MVSIDSAGILEALERSALMIIGIEGRGRVAFANGAARAVFGPLDGLDLSDPPPFDDARSPLAMIAGAWESLEPEPGGSDPFLLRAKADGSSIYLWVQAVPLPAPAGRLLLVADLTRHVTGSEPVRRLVGQLAHDLRSPLTSVSGAAELLLSGRVGALAGVQEKLVKIVDEGAARMASIISTASEEGKGGPTSP